MATIFQIYACILGTLDIRDHTQVEVYTEYHHAINGYWVVNDLGDSWSTSRVIGLVTQITNATQHNTGMYTGENSQQTHTCTSIHAPEPNTPLKRTTTGRWGIEADLYLYMYIYLRMYIYFTHLYLTSYYMLCIFCVQG